MSASNCATGPPRDFGIRPGPPVLPLGVVQRAQTRGALRPSMDGSGVCQSPAPPIHSGLLTNQACFHPFMVRGAGERTWHRGPRTQRCSVGATGGGGTRQLLSAPSATPQLWSWRTNHHRFVPGFWWNYYNIPVPTPSHRLPLEAARLLKVWF